MLEMPAGKPGIWCEKHNREVSMNPKPPVELRPMGELIHRETLPRELDEVVVRDAASVHAEMMADDSLFLLITRQNGDKVRMQVSFDRARMSDDYDGRKKGTRRMILVMAAEEESA